VQSGILERRWEERAAFIAGVDVIFILQSEICHRPLSSEFDIVRLSP